MSTVLKDAISDSLDPKYVLRRAEDWEHRLENLYSMIQSWLPSGWEATAGIPVVMHEELMKRAGIEQKIIPTLKLLSQAGEEIIFKVRGLWVVCANGLIEFAYEGDRYHIYDSADVFKPPKWRVVNPMHWQLHEQLNQDWIRRLLQ